MRHKILIGAFPENGALGEYFFGFGTADIVDPITGIIRKRDIDPGSIVLNYEIIGSRGTRNSTSSHEGTHSYLGHFFFCSRKCMAMITVLICAKEFPTIRMQTFVRPLRRWRSRRIHFPDIS